MHVDNSADMYGGIGGGVAVIQANIISINDSLFAQNNAFLGAGIAMLNGTTSSFDGLNKFIGNHAYIGAGIF